MKYPVLILAAFNLSGGTDGFGVPPAAELPFSVLQLEPESVKGPHGGRIVHAPEGDFELVLNRDEESFDLYSLDAPMGALPEQGVLGLVLSGQRVEVVLRAADPWQGHPHYRSSPISGVGNVNDLGSMMGLQLRFGLPTSNLSQDGP